MNCKQGDLAIVIRSKLGNLGKIVRILEPFYKGFIGPDGRSYGNIGDEPTWIVECDSGLVVQRINGGTISLKIRAFSDAGLRPLRDQPGDDETLEWAGLPNLAGVAA